MLDGRMIWTDVETFGLKPEESPIIELGFVITDLDLVEIDEWSILLWDSPMYDNTLEYLIRNPEDNGNQYVLDMHKKNGLWGDAQAEGFSVAEADEQAHAWLSSHGVNNESMCGSSVQFDLGMVNYWLPKTASHFHYRIVDVSSFKTYIAAKYPAHFADLPPSDTQHRVIPDCKDTINEMKFYDRNFIGLLGVVDDDEAHEAWVRETGNIPS